MQKFRLLCCAQLCSSASSTTDSHCPRVKTLPLPVCRWQKRHLLTGQCPDEERPSCCWTKSEMPKLHPSPVLAHRQLLLGFAPPVIRKARAFRKRFDRLCSIASPKDCLAKQWLTADFAPRRAARAS